MSSDDELRVWEVCLQQFTELVAMAKSIASRLVCEDAAGPGRDSALQLLDAQPKHRGGLSFTAFPLVDDGLAGRADLGGELLLTEAEPVPQANDHRGVIRRYGHTAYCHATT